ncbi:MAG: lipid-A-disaccharide synthase [Candidatus Margulisbacteria bacterium]|nr:lipid-A-disaccharide synthase [Candidatus Margulisiibacteriota bacterium]MBU1021993.1 lipid-A-disaccharide synthase [Candidatus Margulisiibacteriota bacterium]MBU1728971.1 lipid-A-disaccharide synthase [Candidatus Margulisiibacteriota bacterium]MBU1954777.1 lipid-A-disaccharide synthase [Candidatus Margulisiibacteriota bacterium]
MPAAKKILITTLEPSGDLHASRLIKELKSLSPDIKIFGVGGENMKQAGAEIIMDTSKKGVVGLVETLSFLPSLLLAAQHIKKFMDQEKPDLLLCVDSQGFNVPLAAAAKKRGIKTIYYIAPQEWLWGTEKGVKKVVSVVDLIIAIFKKEAAAYKNAGGNVFYQGHPLLDIVKPSQNKEETCNKLGLNPKAPLVALCFGNRKQEIKNLTPLMLRTAKLIKNKLPDCQFVAPLFNHAFEKTLHQQIDALLPEVLLVSGNNYNILNAAGAVLSTPGTVTLECAILETPVVATYKLNPLTYFIGKNILRFNLPYVTMPSLLVGHLVVPEYIQKAATPENLAEEIVNILMLPSRRDILIEKLKEVKKELGSPGAVKKAAEVILTPSPIT